MDENRFTKGASLKNIRAWVTGKILKGSWENKTSLIQKKKSRTRMAPDFSGHSRSKKTKEQHILNSERKQFPT